MIRSLFVFFVTILVACQRNECSKVGLTGVSIKVVNKSGKRVEKIILIRPHRHLHRSIVRSVANNDQTCIAYKAGGESSYQLLFMMDSGDTIKSQEMYAEGGYAFTLTIEKNKVRWHNPSY